MSDIERVIRASKQLEGVLERVYGAQGRGLHEKVSSVAEQLSPSLCKSLRWVATMRNKVVHEDDFVLPDTDGFSQQVAQLLQALAPAPEAQPHRTPPSPEPDACKLDPPTTVLPPASSTAQPRLARQPRAQPDTPEAPSHRTDPAAPTATPPPTGMPLVVLLYVLIVVGVMVWVLAH